ncbi:MAG: ABC transporter substrate-binding protein [Burkholderiales bacterium]|jgi:ABC-type nitrate/sulfonate/bicarbonate transport system substrate-binding protein
MRQAPSSIRRAMLSGIAASGFSPLIARAQSRPERVTIRYGYLPVPTAPLFAGIAHDLFEKENIDLQMIKFTSGPAAFQALQSGSIDAAQGGMPAYYMGTTRGLDVKWVYTYGDYSPIEGLVVPKGSSVRRFEELKGKKVALPTGSMMHLAHLYALQRAGMGIGEVEIVPLQPPQGLAAVINGDVQGAWFWDPNLSQAIDKGAQRIIVNKDLGMLDPFGFAMTTKFLSDRKNVEGTARFIRALIEGQKRFAADPDPTLNSIQKITGIERALSVQLIKGVEWYTAEQQLSADHVMSMANPSDLNRGAAGLVKSKVEGPALWGNVIAKAGDATGFFDNRPLRLALGR